MKTIFLIIALLFLSCSNIEYPQNVLKECGFTGYCVPYGINTIKTKDEIIRYVENNMLKFYRIEYPELEINLMNCTVDTFTVYVNTADNGQYLLSEDIYPKGMPIKMKRKGDYYFNVDKLIITNGYTELADSSYNGYIILPVKIENNGNNEITKFDFNIKFPFEVNKL